MALEYPFAFYLDKDRGNTSIHVVYQRFSNNEVTVDKIVSSKLNIKICFKRSRKQELPFVQNGIFKISDKKGTVYSEKKHQGYLDTLYYTFSPNTFLINNLLLQKDSIDFDIFLLYTFDSLDPWTNEMRTYESHISIYGKLREILSEHKQLYYLQENSTRDMTLHKIVPQESTQGKIGSTNKNSQKNLVLGSKNSFFGRSNKSDALNATSRPDRVNTNMTVLSNKISTATLPSYSSVYLPFLNRKEPIPRVDNPDSQQWVDYYNKNILWQKPHFKWTPPIAGTDINNSSFTFTYRSVGISTSGTNALEAEMIIQVEKKELINKQGFEIRDLKLFELIAKIELPFINELGQSERTTLYANEVKQVGRKLTMNFKVVNQWVRILYAAITTKNLPEIHRPMLSINYQFEGMKKRKQHLSIALSALNIAPLVSMQSLNLKPTIARGNLLTGLNPVRLNKPAMTVSNTSIASLPLTASAFTQPLYLAPTVKLEKEKVNYVTKKISIEEKFTLFVECSVYSDYFLREVEGNITSPFGCIEPSFLGQVETAQFIKIDVLDHQKYSVYRSTIMPQLFIVNPKRYVISRSEDVDNYLAPQIMLYGTVDIENLLESYCVIDVTLQPDICFFERIELKEKLKKFTTHEPQIQYFTEIDGDIIFNIHLSDTLLLNKHYEFSNEKLFVTLETTIQNAQLFKTMLEGNGITGFVKKSIDKDLELESIVHIGLNEIGKSWEGKGLDLISSNGSLEIRNNYESDCFVQRLANPANLSDSMNVSALIPSSSSITRPLQNVIDKLPIYSVVQDQAALKETYSYVEDIFQQIIAHDNFSSDENGSLKEVYVGIRDRLPHTLLQFNLGNQYVESYLLIPIDEIMNSQEFGYYIKYISPQGQLIESDWIPYDFSGNGNIITITNTIIQ